MSRDGSDCIGKKQISERRHAETAAKRRPGLSAYKCKICRSWHVGHAAPKPFRTPHRQYPLRGSVMTCSTDYRVVLCEVCWSEGRIVTGPDPDADCYEPCPWCEGTGGEVIKVEPITLQDLEVL